MPHSLGSFGMKDESINVVKVDFGCRPAPSFRELLKDELVSEFCVTLKNSQMNQYAVKKLEIALEKPAKVLQLKFTESLRKGSVT